MNEEAVGIEEAGTSLNGAVRVEKTGERQANDIEGHRSLKKGRLWKKKA